MGFRVGRRLEEKRIKHRTEDSLRFFFFFPLFAADNYKPPVELITHATAGAPDKVLSYGLSDGACQHQTSVFI